MSYRSHELLPEHRHPPGGVRNVPPTSSFFAADEVGQLLTRKHLRAVARRAAEVLEVAQRATKLPQPAVLIRPTTAPRESSIRSTPFPQP